MYLTTTAAGQGYNKLYYTSSIHYEIFELIIETNFHNRVPLWAYPIKNLQRKFYATIIFKDPDWLINLSSQSECLKN